MIWRLLKDQTRYDLLKPTITVMRWVKADIDELVEEEMGSNTQVEQDDFKVVIGQFPIQINTVQTEIDYTIKVMQTQAIELFRWQNCKVLWFLA